MLKFEIELPRAGLPSALDITGIRYGLPRRGDWSLQITGKWELANVDFALCRQLIAVVKPIEIWEPATVQDAIDALSGKKVVCRVWDGKSVDIDDRMKLKGHLTGYGPACVF